MALGQVDVRGVLQYVPQFSGKVFVVLFDEDLLPEAAIAETLLDLAALQSVGVKLVLGVLGGSVEDFYNWVVEVEMKAARSPLSLQDPDVITSAKEILNRGQACVVDATKVEIFDEAIITFAKGVSATKLIILLDEDGIVRNGEPIHAVPQSECENLVKSDELIGVDLLLGAARVCRSGIDRVHVLNGLKQGVLVEELFSNEGVGTMVHADSYREIREIREEDIPELLAMIGRSVRDALLVPRSYEDIWGNRDSYQVMTVDDNVVGCVAMYRYKEDPSVVELACLYVKQSHEGLGYGHDLVEFVMRRAKKEGIKRVFALTTRAANYFAERFSWVELTLNDIPKSRRIQLQDSGRESRIFATSK